MHANPATAHINAPTNERLIMFPPNHSRRSSAMAVQVELMDHTAPMWCVKRVIQFADCSSSVSLRIMRYEKIARAASVLWATKLSDR
jgi:hypothetical protein